MTSFAGSRWWRFDFHTHTPASTDYGNGKGQEPLRKISSEAWLLGFMRAEIDCVAVTDHNTGAWVDKIKTAYEGMREARPTGFRELTIFPGVEITASGGAHVLAVFDPSRKTEDIDKLLGAVEYKGDPGKSDTAAECAVVQVVRKIHTAGGLPILAHVDGASSAFSVKGNTLTSLLDVPELFAMEVCAKTFAVPQLYADKKLAWAQVVGSDAHHPDGKAGQNYPGSRFTWVKMGAPALEGLRLALLDGSPLSVQRSDSALGNLNDQIAEQRIGSMSIADAQYCGRGVPLVTPLSPWLTAIIGGRGTGKSTVIELLRLALRRENDVPDGLKSDLARFRPFDGRVGGSALTEKTEISVEYTKDRQTYRIYWRASSQAPSIERLDSGAWKPTEGVVRERFPVRILSQKEIYLLAEAPRALLQIIDDTVEVNRAEWNQRCSQEENRYLSLRATARRLRAELETEASLRGQLEDVKGKLAVFEKAAHADVLKVYQRRQGQRRQLSVVQESLSGFEASLQSIQEQLTLPDVDRAGFDSKDPGDAAALALIEDAKKVAARIGGELRGTIERARQSVAEWSAGLAASRWTSAATQAAEKYKALVTTLKSQGVADPSQYGALVQQRQLAEQRLAALNDTRTTLARADTDADASLKTLEVLRGELTARRSQFLAAVLKGNEHVRIEVQPYDSDEFSLSRELRRLLGCEGDKHEQGIDSLVAVLRDAIQKSATTNATEFQTSLRSFKMLLGKVAQGKSAELGAWFEKHIRTLPPETLDRLQMWFPEDGVRVSYSRRGDGRAWESIQQGSPGQKTAAILAFLLCHGTEPIVLDQPEDDLDNQLITDLVVAQIRSSKSHRQVIVSTHNPNIVVNGDAEQVFVMDMRKGQCVVVASGGLQSEEVREQICLVMEGGREAFQQRYQRIVTAGDSHVR